MKPLRCIAAMDAKRGIGKNNSLPWRLKLVFSYAVMLFLRPIDYCLVVFLITFFGGVRLQCRADGKTWGRQCSFVPHLEI